MPVTAAQRNAPAVQRSAMRQSRAGPISSLMPSRNYRVVRKTLCKGRAHDAEKRRMMVSCHAGGAIDSTGAIQQEPTRKCISEKENVTEAKPSSKSRVQEAKSREAHREGMAQDFAKLIILAASAPLCVCAGMTLLAPNASAATVEVTSIVENVLASIGDGSLSDVGAILLGISAKALKTIGVRSPYK